MSGRDQPQAAMSRGGGSAASAALRLAVAYGSFADDSCQLLADLEKAVPGE